MVIKAASGIYMHAAWAKDEEGTGFSLTKFDTAQYVGHYSDKSAEESASWRKYEWQAIQEAEDEEDDGAEIVEDESELDDEEEEEADGNIVSSDDVIEGLMDDIGDTAEEVQSVGADSTATQNLSDTGLGNDNLLSGTNRGLSGWTIPGGFSAEAVTGTIYDDTAEAVNYIKITCGTAGAGTLQFDAGDLPEKLAHDGGSAYTLTADVAMSTCFSMPAYVGKPDGTAEQIEFGTIDNSGRDLEESGENDGVWVPAALTAGALGVAADGQALCFDLSSMPAGATLEIANLKIEEGAMATPWKKSIKEVAKTADGASSAASSAQSAASKAQKTADTATTNAAAAQETADSASTAATAAQTAAEAADGKAAAAQSTASKAQTAAEAAQSTADTAKSTAEATAQHFWTNDEGAHITKTPQGEPISGGSTLITGEGMEVRDGNTPLASFKKDGAVIGENNTQKIRITDKAFEAANADGKIAAKISSEYGGKEITETEELHDLSGADTLVLSFSPVAGSAITVDVFGSSAALTFTQGTAETKVVMSTFGSRTIVYDGDKTFTGGSHAKFTYTSSQPNGKVLSLADDAIFAKWNGDFYAREIDTKGVAINGQSLSDLFSGKISIGTTSTGALSISAGGNTGDMAIDIYKDGFSARCIVGWNLSGTGASNCMISKLYIHQTDQQIHYYIKNTGSAKATPKLNAYVLYTKAN